MQIATRLKAALEAHGIRAELTRSTDVFISLAERTQIANRADANLFVSIHLNSSPNTDTTGIEVYYLNNTTDRATIRLARMENGGTDGITYPENKRFKCLYTPTPLIDPSSYLLRSVDGERRDPQHRPVSRP